MYYSGITIWKVDCTYSILTQFFNLWLNLWMGELANTEGRLNKATIIQIVYSNTPRQCPWYHTHYTSWKLTVMMSDIVCTKFLWIANLKLVKREIFMSCIVPQRKKKSLSHWITLAPLSKLNCLLMYEPTYGDSTLFLNLYI